MRRFLLPLALLVVAAAAGVGAERAEPDLTPPPLAPGETATPTAIDPLAPVLTARRAPGLLARPVGDRRLIRSLEGVMALSPPASCLTVSEGGRVLFERSPDAALTPASALKLVTAVGILHHLRADTRFTTEVRVARVPVGGVLEGDLHLVGGGDPVLGTAEWGASFEHQPALRTPLEALADQVVAAGVLEVRGRVVGDDSRYDRARTVASWPERYAEDVGPLSALTVNDGFARFEPGNVQFAEPASGAAGVLLGLLEARGVTVAGGAAAGPAPATAPMATVSSPTTGELVASMVRESDNGTAELLVKEVGLRVKGVGSTAAGLAAVAEALTALGIPGAGARLVDGSGLDRGNALTCRLLSSLLAGVDDGAVDAALPVAGISGTLTERFEDSPLTGRLRAKTGTLRDVAALAGFAEAASGADLTFSYLLNGPDADDQAVALQAALGAALVAYPDLPTLDELGPAGYGAPTP